jgi:hypothetical protein
VGAEARDLAAEIAREVLRLDKDLGGRWYESGPPWGERGYVFSGSDDPHAGRFVCTCDDPLVIDEPELEEHAGEAPPEERAEAIAFLRNESPVMARAYLALAEQEEHFPQGPFQGPLREARKKGEEVALKILHEWLDVTGLIPPGTGYYYEMEAVVEDAVECGVRAALGALEEASAGSAGAPEGEG